MSGLPVSEQDTSSSTILECDFCHIKLGIVPTSKYVGHLAFVPIVRCMECENLRRESLAK